MINYHHIGGKKGLKLKKNHPNDLDMMRNNPVYLESSKY